LHIFHLPVRAMSIVHLIFLDFISQQPVTLRRVQINKIPHYAIVSSLLSLYSSKVQMFTSPPCSHTLSSLIFFTDVP
jgi:hypothetical protein